MVGIRHATSAAALTGGAKIGATDWDNEHQVDDGGIPFVKIGSLPSTLMGYGIPLGAETAIGTTYTLALTDYRQTLTFAADSALTIPTGFPAGFEVTLSAASLVRVTITLDGGQTIDRDAYIRPGETTTLIYTGTTWRRRLWRGFGVGTLGSAGLLSDMDDFLQPSGLSRTATGLTANLTSKPSHMSDAMMVLSERHTTTAARQTVWGYSGDSGGAWSRQCQGSVWSLWRPEHLAMLPTASLPTNVVTGSVVYDTTLSKLVVWTGSAWTPVTASWADVINKPSSLAGYGIADDHMLPMLIPSVSEWITSNGYTTSTTAVLSNSMILCPWRCPADMTIDALGLSVTVAGTVMKLGILSAGAQNRPGSLLGETADIDISATGPNKFGTITPVALTKGAIYWLYLRSSGGFTFTAGQNVFVANGLGVYTTPATGTRGSLTRSLTYATATPSPWTWSMSDFSTNSSAWFQMRRSA